MSPAAARARARRASPRRFAKPKPNPGLDRLSRDFALRLKIEDLIAELLGPAIDDTRGEIHAAVDKINEAKGLIEEHEKHDGKDCERCKAELEVDLSGIDFDVDVTPLAESIIELLRDEGR